MVYPSHNNALRFSSRAGDLYVSDQKVPPLAANEILVKVHAASINPVDVQLWRSGLVAVVAGDKGMGRDFSGKVVSVGKAVKGWAEGNEIFGLLFSPFGQGTFSQYISINPNITPVAKKPSCFSHEAAASIPLAALTAYACLDWLPPPGTFQRRVVVRGASGGTGSCIVQLAKVSYDCHVTAICSSKNVDYVKSLGADEVIDYTSRDVVQSLLSARAVGQPMDLIIDCVGGTEIISIYQKLLHTSGAYVTIVGDKTSVTTIGGPITYLTNPIQIFRYLHGIIFGPRYACVSLYMKSKYLEQVVVLGERGEFTCEVQEVIRGAFDENDDLLDDRKGWRRAVSLIEGVRIRGKVVLEVA